MIIDELKNQFNIFQKSGEKAKIVELLTTALKNENFNDEERCWALWNISDNLAMLRNSNDELVNHKLFENQILNMDVKYLHWIVSDCTQKMTLLIGGYEQYWIDLYKYACINTPFINENKRIRFESHRATVATPMIIEYSFDKDNSLFALDNMKKMLPKLKDDYNYYFYELIYYTQYIGAYTLLGENFNSILEESLKSFERIYEYLYADKNEPDDNNLFILGSWQQLNGKRSKYNQAKCAINNYIISLINAGQYKIALECYDKISLFNINYGNYFNVKIAFAKEKCNTTI